MKACIATPKYPTNFAEFLTSIKAIAEDFKVEVKGYVVVPGRGCWNHGVIVEGADAEKFMKYLTHAMTPAKWGEVDESDPAVIEGQFEFQQES